MEKTTNTTRSVLITGASSGLGKALALAYAKQGLALHLSGRNKARLDDVVALCQSKGADVYPKVADVTDEAAMLQWIEEAWAKAPFDVVIANAGISAGTSGQDGHASQQEPLSQVKAIFDANVAGVIHTIVPCVNKMLSRSEAHRGSIAIVSSLAGLRGLPSSPSYSGSKAAVRVYGDAMRGLLKPKGIDVSVVIPGYIDTPMTAVNRFPMPCQVTAEKAALIIKKGIMRRKAQIVFPFVFAMMVRFLSVLPVWLTDPLFSRLPGKPSLEAQHDKA
jgi:short-subunit dehydrogenase